MERSQEENIVRRQISKKSEDDEVILTKFDHNQDSHIETGYINGAYEEDEPKANDFKTGKIDYWYTLKLITLIYNLNIYNFVLII